MVGILNSCAMAGCLGDTHNAAFCLTVAIVCTKGIIYLAEGTDLQMMLPGSIVDGIRRELIALNTSLAGGWQLL